MDVNVERSTTQAYFTDGWIDILCYYDLHFGAWIKLYYLRDVLFEIEIIETRNFKKVLYPVPTWKFQIDVKPYIVILAPPPSPHVIQLIYTCQKNVD